MKFPRILLFSVLVFFLFLATSTTNASYTKTGTYFTITIPNCEHIEEDIGDCTFTNKTGYTFERSGENNIEYNYEIHERWSHVTEITGTGYTGTTIYKPLDVGEYYFTLCNNMHNCDSINFNVSYKESIEITQINNIETSGNIVFNRNRNRLYYPEQLSTTYTYRLGGISYNPKTSNTTTARYTVKDLIDAYPSAKEYPQTYEFHVKLYHPSSYNDQSIAISSISFTGSLTGKSVKLINNNYDDAYQTGNYTIYTFRNRTDFTFERSGYDSKNNNISYDYTLYASITNETRPNSRRLYNLYEVTHSGSTNNTGITINNIGTDAYKFEVCIKDTDFCDTTYFNVEGNQQHTVTITSSNTGYGTVSSGSVTANSGTTISTNGNTLTIGSTDVIATPNNSHTTIESFSFSGWTNKCGNSLTGDCEIIADFNKSSPEHGDDPTPQPGTQEREFTLTFDTDGGSPIAPITGVYGSTISKPNNPTKTGYTFSGWNPAIPDKMPTNNLTVTAQRTANKYKVEFNANSGQGRMGQQDFIYDISENLNQNQFTKSGYTFSGWNTSPSGNQTWFTDQQFVKNLTGTSGAVVTLYAQWTAEPGTNPGDGGGGNTETTYTVTITSSNTGYGTVSSGSVTANSGTTISTNGNTLTIGSTNVIATPNNSHTTIESFSFSGWTNKCGNSLTGDCEIIADFKLNNQGNNGGNGSQSSSTSSSNGGSSGKSHKNEEKKSETEDTDYVKTIYELINNTRENHININKDETIQSNQFFSKYISRSCKPYNIEYIPSLNAYTSPDLKKKEYFVNIEYFKRYVDSKNAQNAECYVTNRSRITKSYIDTSNSNNRFVAPNGKIYFINQQNGFYRSSDINSSKNFTTIDELKNYIKKRNPLIPM